MSLAKFQNTMFRSRFKQLEKKWFPIWVERYAEFLKAGPQETLKLTRDSVVRFSQLLRDNGVEAWQRQQAVTALAVYRDIVLHRNDRYHASIS